MSFNIEHYRKKCNDLLSMVQENPCGFDDSCNLIYTKWLSACCAYTSASISHLLNLKLCCDTFKCLNLFEKELCISDCDLYCLCNMDIVGINELMKLYSSRPILKELLQQLPFEEIRKIICDDFEYNNIDCSGLVWSDSETVPTAYFNTVKNQQKVDIEDLYNNIDDLKILITDHMNDILMNIKKCSDSEIVYDASGYFTYPINTIEDCSANNINDLVQCFVRAVKVYYFYTIYTHTLLFSRDVQLIGYFTFSPPGFYETIVNKPFKEVIDIIICHNPDLPKKIVGFFDPEYIKDILNEDFGPLVECIKYSKYEY